MDQPEGSSSPGTLDGTPGRTSTRITLDPVRNPMESSASSVTPGKRAGSLSSPILEHTKRTVREAQAFRTAVRVAELGLEPSDNEGKSDRVEEQPDESSSQVYPGTAARRNVTMRRSHDRLSNRPMIVARTPDAVLVRRSLSRERDRRYSMESDFGHGATSSRTYDRKNNEDVRGSYSLPQSSFRTDDRGSSFVPPSPFLALNRAPLFAMPNGSGEDNYDPMAGKAKLTNPNPVVRIPNSNQRPTQNLRSEGEKEELLYPNPDSSNSDHPVVENESEGPNEVIGKDGSSPGDQRTAFDPFEFFLSSDQAQNSPDGRKESEEEGDDEQGDLPLFLRRDIPDESEDPDVAEILNSLWDLRKESTENLARAMEDDDVDMFDKHEDQIRHFNKQMHQVKTTHLKRLEMQRMNDAYQRQSASKYVSVDDLSLGQRTPFRKRSHKENDDGEFKIRLNYQGDIVIRNANTRTLNRVVYYLAQQYLREVFSLNVDSFSKLLLIHRGTLLSLKGKLEDVPVVDGDEIMVIFRQDEEQRFNPRASDGDQADHHREESHGLYHAPAGDHADPHRVEGHGIYHAPAGDHADHHRVGSHRPNDARAPSQPGNTGGAAQRRVSIQPWKTGGALHHAPRINREESHGLYHPSADDHLNHRRVESHGLYHAPVGDYADHRRVETHGLYHARAPSQPGNNGGASTLGEQYTMLYDQRSSRLDLDNNSGSRSYDKIRQSFKCPRFSGQTKEWKTWNKGFMRYLSIWDLDYVLDPDFCIEMPLTPVKKRDNKMVYYIIEDSVQNSPLAASYVRQAPVNNGFEAYYTLHDGFVFAGTSTATLLLNELSNFRFLPDETPTALCLRLEELFEELELLPGNAAVTFVDTQRIGYLVNALRHEKEWDVVCSAITSAQIKGEMTFRQACNELRFRCETTRVHEIMDKPVKGKKVRGLAAKAQSTDASEPEIDAVSEQLYTLLSTISKRHNASSTVPVEASSDKKKTKKKYIKMECLVADCAEETTFPLCGLHYHSLVSGKTPTLKLRNGYGDATYDATTSLIVYPPRTPTDRLPSNTPRKVKAGLAGPN